MAKFVQKDKFLKYILRKEYRNTPEPHTLERMFAHYVENDKTMSKEYNKIK